MFCTLYISVQYMRSVLYTVLHCPIHEECSVHCTLVSNICGVFCNCTSVSNTCVVFCRLYFCAQYMWSVLYTVLHCPIHVECSVHCTSVSNTCVVFCRLYFCAQYMWSVLYIVLQCPIYVECSVQCTLE